MKNLILFSLYGLKDKYWKGALSNIKLAKEIYPNYICRFYIDQDAPEYLKDTIVGDNVEKIFMENIGGISGMFWRFLGAADEDVDVCLCRDCDSNLNTRERSAVEEWLQSDKDFHIMRDHSAHNKRIMGGMWGSRNKLMKRLDLKLLINNWGKKDKYGDDQVFLGTQIYPLIKNLAFEHSECNVKFDNPIHKFPKNDYKGFVGQIMYR